MSDKSHDYVISIAFPGKRPTEDETSLYTDTVEPFLNKLVEDGYLTKEELAAYIMFVAQFSQLSPFILDEFLNQYRQATKGKASSGLYLPG